MSLYSLDRVIIDNNHWTNDDYDVLNGDECDEDDIEHIYSKENIILNKISLIKKLF